MPAKLAREEATRSQAPLERRESWPAGCYGSGSEMRATITRAELGMS